MERIKQLLLALMFVCSMFISKAQNINDPNKMGPLGTQVNTISGNLFIPRTDFVVTARGFDIDATFYYNSYLFNEDVGYGNGWTFMYSIQYKADSLGGRIILWGDGREDTYDSLPGGGYKAPLGFFSKLAQYQSGKYKLTELDSTTYFFDNATHRKITRMQDANGNFINFNYTDTLLTSLSNAAGQAITLTYTNGKLASIIDAIAVPNRTFTYAYDAAGNLKEVKDPLNGKEKYSYLVNGPMKTISDKNNNTVDIIYYPDFSTSELIGCNKRLSFSYDTLSKKTIATDHFDNGGSNQVTTYTYKKLDNIAWITSMSGNCCGYNINYEYDDQGNQVKMTDANGQVYQYTYDANGNMLTMKDPLGQISTYTYSSNYNKITGYKDAKGFLYTLAYDAKGNMTQLVTPGNNIYTAAYNANGDIISSTDPKGNVFTYNYDAYGNPTNVTGPNGYEATLGYDARGNLLSYTDARGNHTAAEYDILDRLKKITDPVNSNIQLGYDANGNIIAAQNKNNESSIFNYDASNRIVKVTGPTGNQVNLNYDAMDKLTSAKNALGYQTKFYYDTRNRLTGVKDAEGNNNNLSYDANGNITHITKASGQTINYAYDALNRLTGVSDNSGSVAGFTYDENNNITSYTNGTGAVVSAIYDSLNRIKQITDPLGNSAAYTYDKNNNVSSVTDRNGITSHRTYDSLNRVKTFTDNNGFVTTVGYDAESNVISLTDQNNHTTTYLYDSLNRRKQMTYPGGSFVQYAYDKKSNLISKRLTDGGVINYQYDTLNRVISRTLPGGEVYGYVYDALNRVVAATNNTGTVYLTYDGLNRIVSENFDGRTTRYNYNITGRTQTTIYPDSSVIVKEFDTRNRLIKISKDSVTVVEYAYNNANQLTNKAFANGVNSIMQYDFANRLSSINTSNGTIQNSNFTYDKEMNKTAITRINNPGLSEQFTYDNGYRLTNYKRGPAGSPVTQNMYTYDAVGNRTQANLNGTNVNYNINNLNQITGTSGGQNVSFSYDGRGNLTYDGLFYKTYDAEGRLLKDSASLVNVIAYAYDAFNRRINKVNNGNLFKYTYSGVAQIEERDAGNNLLNKTVFTNFLSPVLNAKNGNNYYYHQNELNSVEAITNNSGRLLERYQYDVYGKQSRYDSLNNPLASSLAGNRFGFTGQEYDSATKSYRFFYRNYSPETGIFNQRDLIEYSDGMGMYQYVGNNPANGLDIWGLDAVDDKYDLPKGYSYDVGKMYGGDPCFHDSKKIKYITRWEIQRTKEAMLEYLKAFPGRSLMSDFEAIGSADSRYYTGLSRNQIPTGDNMYYFNGQEMHNYEANYFFTGYAGGTRGYGATEAQGLARGWNGAKGLLEVGEGKGLGRLKSILDPNDTRASMMEKGALDGQHENGIGDIAPSDIDPGVAFDRKFDNKTVADFGEWWPVINPRTGEKGYEFFAYKKIKSEKVMAFRRYVKENCSEAGTRKLSAGVNDAGQNANMEIVKSHDPNEMIGPVGQPPVHWVSVKDRLPYTILFENSEDATAPAKYVRITTPVEPKQDASTFQVGNFGFNSTTFTVPPNTTAYYNRLDARDSIGLYVDVTAGYDQLNNVAFWEFQSIDPITLQPPADPLKGFLLQQDSNSLVNGHGFVNFSIKPKQNSLTLDTIGARAEIVFDNNDTIPTNIYTNTIDAFAPTSHMNSISMNTNPITLSWSGVDDVGGCGIDYYTIYVSTDQVNYSVLIPKISRTDTTLTLPPDTSYCFFVLATDRVGNRETLRPGEIQCTYVGPPLPVTWLYFRGKTVAKDNILDWATANEQNSKQFDVERSLNGTDFNRIGIVNASGNSGQSNTYQYTDHDIDRLNSEYMFYRLKQIDIDGRFKYSNIVRLRYNEKNAGNTIVYPNPTPGSVTILVGDRALIGTVAALYDVNGRMLENIKISAGSQTVDLSRYVTGIYFIRLNNKEVLKIIKN